MNTLLDRAVQALRDESAIEADGAITRQRIEAGLLQRRARGRALHRLAAVAAMTLLLGGGALAATGLVLRPRPANPDLAPARTSRPLATHHVQTATPDERAPTAPVAESSAADTPSAVARPASQPAVAGGATSAYAAAHRAHFVDRDFPQALVLWTRYLRLAPAGPLSPEAHFNRAICLLRLDRRQDAAAELQPFARGRWGSYRQSEARQLLEQSTHQGRR